jgi:RNA polymerase sigma factor (sigma-70 family)
MAPAHHRRTRTPGPERAARRSPRLSDERELLLAAKARDRAARQRLVELHAGLVRSVASHYRDLGLPIEDLVQEGSIGLLEAIERFDAARGASFSTYARWCVRRAITRALTDNSRLVRLPKGVVERNRAVAQTRSSLRARLGHDPTAEEIAAAAGLPLAAVTDAMVALSIASLDEPVTPDGSPLEQLVADPSAAQPETTALAHERELAVAKAVAKLPPRQRRVIEAYFGLGGEQRSLVELAEELALSPQRARALEHDALHRLWGELEPFRG